MNKVKFRFIAVLLVLLITPSQVVLAFDNTPPVTTHTLSGTVGNNGWYSSSVGVALDATDTDGEVASIEYWVDSGTHNTVNFLSGAPAQVEFNVSSNGTHTISYFATNADGVAEETKTTPVFKIDTAAPANWRDFQATEYLNNHTFTLAITVDDLTSGLDVSTAYYNYTVDGINYGYYTNSTSCSSTFVPQDPNKEPYEANSGWRSAASVSPNVNGSTTVTINTHPLDFCNSSWNLNEAVQFYIRDMAGNEAYKLQLLFGPWVDTQKGDIHSQGQINFSSEGSADYVVSSNVSPINNLVSTKGWYVAPYDMPLTNMSYSYWYSKLGSPTTGLPSGRLPTVKGVYRVNGDFTIDSGTIPAGLATTQNFGAVVFINGRLTINNDFSLHSSSGLVFIVRDDLRTYRTVNNIAGFYIVDDNIDISYNGNNSQLFTLTGGIVGNGTWRFGKNIGGQGNLASPGERFVFQPSYLNNKDIVSYLSVAPTYQWSEEAP